MERSIFESTRESFYGSRKPVSLIDISKSLITLLRPDREFQHTDLLLLAGMVGAGQSKDYLPEQRLMARRLWRRFLRVYDFSPISYDASSQRWVLDETRTIGLKTTLDLPTNPFSQGELGQIVAAADLASQQETIRLLAQGQPPGEE